MAELAGLRAIGSDRMITLLRQHKQGRTENIVPMINVALLLLVFFMIAAVISPEPPIDLDLPNANAEEIGEAVNVFLGPNGALVLQDGSLVKREAVAGSEVALFAAATEEATVAASAIRQLREFGAAGIALVANDVGSESPGE